MSNIYGEYVVYCDRCKSVGPFRDMSPYKGLIFSDPGKHIKCGGKLHIAYHKKIDTSGSKPIVYPEFLKASEWGAMSPEERQKAIKENWESVSELERLDREVIHATPLTREESKKISNFQKYYNDNLTCPVCGSHVVKKLTTADRAVSVAAWGLASGKIGKQYECKDCGHKW